MRRLLRDIKPDIGRALFSTSVAPRLVLCRTILSFVPFLSFARYERCSLPQSGREPNSRLSFHGRKRVKREWKERGRIRCVRVRRDSADNEALPLIRRIYHTAKKTLLFLFRSRLSMSRVIHLVVDEIGHTRQDRAWISRGERTRSDQVSKYTCCNDEFF